MKTHTIIMEFLLFLSSKEKEILDLIYKAGFTVEENTPLCLISNKYVGFVKKRQQTVVICTENVKKINGYSYSGKRHYNDDHGTTIAIRKALRHEATHVAQACNGGRPMNAERAKMNMYSWYKKNAINKSTQISNTNQDKEVEAYYLEDRPNDVISSLKKYCF